MKGYKRTPEESTNPKDKLIRKGDELDKVIWHIVQLIKDAHTLYKASSYSSSAFLSITSCEETVKAHWGMYSNGKNKEGNDFFKSHKMKHELSAAPTIPIGTRLANAIGEAEQKKIMNMAQNSGLIHLREQAIYFERTKDEIKVPSEKIDKKRAKELLLYAIEVFDDALVGYTNESFRAGNMTDKMFESIDNG